jgi:catechol 2,3-dioxygenase-like lactoylglutathione lyase family enzyme
MAFHHVAVAVRDLAATHRFYTEAMGFQLVKTVVNRTEHPDGWAKHLFYDTGDGLIAFWEIHDPSVDTDRDLSLSRSLGLPTFVNHIAFAARDLDDLVAKRDHWRDCGHDVAQVDHGFIVSIYTVDPDGTMVEFAADTRALDDDDRAEAARLLADPDPHADAPPMPQLFRARQPASEAAAEPEPAPAR